MNTEVYFIRHAESIYVQGEDETRGLTKKGFQDADGVYNLLKDKGVSHIISSPYQRAIQTVEFLSTKLKVEIELDNRLRERKLAEDSYQFENHVAAVRHAFTYPEMRFAGGESNEEAMERGVACLRQLVHKHRGKNIVLATHGNLMVCTLNYFDPCFNFAFWKSTSMPDIYKLTISEEFKMVNWERIGGF